MQIMRGKKMTELRQNEKADVEPGGCMALSTRNQLRVVAFWRNNAHARVGGVAKCHGVTFI